MSYSLLNASAHTHLKIVVVALVGAILIVLSGITAHVNASRDIAGVQVHAPVVKAAKPVSYTGRGETLVR
jgi:hypothetical protein